MNLHGSIRDLQNRIAQLYLALENRFSENSLIRDLWSAMANDVAQQIRGLNAFPQSFWNLLKKDKDLSLAAAAEDAIRQSIDNEEDKSLRGCFNCALFYEEPIILKIYAPLIRKLRENSSEPALDFYITVKAHLARITRATRSFSGDPVIIQRANSLLQVFEKEVQEPHTVVLKAEKKKKVVASPPSKTQKVTAKKTGKANPKARSIAKPAKILHRRPKPLVKKVGIPRRRAHR